jgi:beta-lactamase class A
VLEFSNRPDSRRHSSRPQASVQLPAQPPQGQASELPQQQSAKRVPSAKKTSRRDRPEIPARGRRPTRPASPAASLQGADPRAPGTMPLRPKRKRFFLLELFSHSPLARTRPIAPRSPEKKPASRTEPTKRRSRLPVSPAKPQRPTSMLVHTMRLLIVGVGVGAIAGTSLSVWNPAMRSSAAVAQAAPPQVMAANALSGGQNIGHIAKNTLGSGQELPGLIAKIAPMTQGLTDLTPGVFMVDLDKGDYYSFNSDMVFSAASTIKVPLLIAFFQDVDAGKIRLDEVMTMETADIVDNSGEMQYAPPGTKYSALEVATNMIVISDNTATNMIIRRLGGIDKVNQRFKQWGLQQTVIRDRLPDLTGTNTTSPKELTTLLTAVSQGQLISMASRDRAMFIMSKTETDSLLPSAMGAGAQISHKTGDIKSMVGDSGIIDMPSGKRYVITTLMKRSDNDSRAQDLIRQIASTIYQYLDPTHPSAEEPAADSTTELDVPQTDAASDPTDPAVTEPEAAIANPEPSSTAPAEPVAPDASPIP